MCNYVSPPLEYTQQPPSATAKWWKGKIRRARNEGLQYHQTNKQTKQNEWKEKQVIRGNEGFDDDVRRFMFCFFILN